MGRTAHDRKHGDAADAVESGRELARNGTVHVLGPAGEIRDVPVVHPAGTESADAPVLRQLQAEGRATRPRSALLNVAVKRSSSASMMSDALERLRRE